VSGGTKLNVRVQLYTPEGRLVLDNVVEGDAGLTGDNSRATHNLAHNVAVTLKRPTLPNTRTSRCRCSCHQPRGFGEGRQHSATFSKAGRPVRFESVLLALSKTSCHELIATCTDNLFDVIDTSLSLDS
jgi:hypothetical protein